MSVVRVSAIVLGLSAASIDTLHGHARRRAFTWIVLGTLLVALPFVAAAASHEAKPTRDWDARAVEVLLAGRRYEAGPATTRSPAARPFARSSPTPPEGRR